MRSILLLLALQVSIGQVTWANDEITVFAVDAIHERYLFGQRVDVGVFVQNKTGEPQKIVVEAKADLPGQYLTKAEADRRSRWGGRFAYKELSLKPTQALTLRLPVVSAWRYQADYSADVIDIAISVTLMMSNNAIMEQSLGISVEKPQSKRGRDIWQRFLLSNDDNCCGVISSFSISTRLAPSSLMDNSEAFREWISSEYCEQMASDPVISMKLQSWLEIPAERGVDPKKRLDILRREQEGRRKALGASSQQHPSECMLLAAVGLHIEEDREPAMQQLLICSQGNEYYKAFGKYLIEYYRSLYAEELGTS
jgi:hypothetical protein